MEVLREVRENATVVTPTGDTGARSVQQQERRAVAGFVVPEHTEIGLQFLQSSLVAQFSRHGPNGAISTAELL